MAGYLDSNAIILVLNVLDGFTMFNQYWMMARMKYTCRVPFAGMETKGFAVRRGIIGLIPSVLFHKRL